MCCFENRKKEKNRNSDFRYPYYYSRFNCGHGCWPWESREDRLHVSVQHFFKFEVWLTLLASRRTQREGAYSTPNWVTWIETRPRLLSIEMNPTYNYRGRFPSIVIWSGKCIWNPYGFAGDYAHVVALWGRVALRDATTYAPGYAAGSCVCK